MDGFKKPKLNFWKPGTDAPPDITDERVDNTSEVANAAIAAAAATSQYPSLSIGQLRERLPVFKCRSHILYLLENYETLIVVGETGSGKSTQIPQYLLEAGWAAGSRCVAITEPRRVAAVTLATRVSEERGTELGREVGYAVRFDDCSHEGLTRVKFLTDGLLVREMLSDPLLKKYSVVMLDEAHERSVQTDIAIGLLRKIQRRRSLVKLPCGGLKIIVASATLDAEHIQDFFNANETSDSTKDTVAIISVEGREFPVDILYVDDPVPDYVKATVTTIMSIHNSEKTHGDILAFLTGQEEVETVLKALIEEAKRLPKDAPMRMKVLPMYGALSVSDQMRVFERPSRSVRKIVVATNIAETSVTIDGIVHVVDCGFTRTKAYNVDCGTDALIVVPISQAAADQRAGRAGRVRAGRAYRLYTEESYQGLRSADVPEIQRCDCAPTILQLKALGIDDILHFKYLSPPPAQNVARGLELLYALGAVDDNGHLTQPVGLSMAELPLNPMFGKVFLSSAEFGCSEEVITLIAMSQIQNVFVAAAGEQSKSRVKATRQHRRFSVAEGDHITLINVYDAFIKNNRSSGWCKEHFINHRGLKRAVELREQLVRLAHSHKIPLKSCEGDVSAVIRCLITGFFSNAAKYHPSGVYRTIRDDHELSIHPTSVLYTEEPAKYVIFGSVVHSRREYMRDLTVVKEEWLIELASNYYDFGTDRERAEKMRR